MYLYHFGLRELPFTLTPNTQFYCELAPHQEALQVLHTALAAGEGFIKVTGEVGMGKTLLCRKLLRELGERYRVAYLPNPYLSPDEMRRAVAQELGIASGGDQQQLTSAISERLLELAMAGQQVVLLLDEAQALPDETLEALRLFTNLETERFKLLQMVMFGQPELDVRLAQPQLRQLRQRITFSYALRGLTREECGAYLSHRLKMAGYQGDNLFSPGQVEGLWRASGGVPRLLNVLGHKVLMLSFGRGEFRIDNTILSAAVADTEAAQPWQSQWQRYRLWALVVLAVVLLGTGLALRLWPEALA
ncbi:MSHA biogenesis protein MshM [Ferrimonas balearica DSM 9799]|uniref:MSHA biogenesis protein MshM n=1 Tax=Ferrimonas balearica (strain DSM 9799 / CCM 4581 / KCTC 23876 / PAT) TaxID=550540 RepID=E1SN16_FERBD|nr:AAA family ATPase [Ferrimonas balearica]ADN77674.1 MSHA biogenesis protein MshM [Ferrimonas balearica DSM 9799]MBW3140963.1 AAA family ATPase [Ferrimonas balearica]MBW3165837.1 AAA family ATPase [Ferrimonas balearica]MBY6108013.1 AAA family ATPase [Ferrimonas balearica]MBY6225353.1 AAA family ATPase [Ferrimonas balearica]